MHIWYLWQHATDFDTLGTAYLILSIVKILDFTVYRLENACELCISVVPTNESQLQLWVRWQTYSRYFQIICAIKHWLCQYLEFLYVTIVNPRFLNWPECFRKFFRPGSKGIHKIYWGILLKQHADFYGVFWFTLILKIWKTFNFPYVCM